MNIDKTLPSAQDLLYSEIEPGLARIELARASKYNALSEALLTDLHEHLLRISNDPSIRVLLVSAQGKAFCAGHDLSQMIDNPTLGYYQSLFSQCTRVMTMLQKMPQVVIAQVQGVATAAGCQIVGMCDLAVAARSARFAVSGINLGLFCSTPAVALSRNLSRKRAFELLMTGEFLSAEQARDEGLINRVVDDDHLVVETLHLARQILAKSPQAVRAGKQLFYKQLEMGIEAAYQLAGHTMACNMMDQGAQSGVKTFLKR
jgi:enoyl-CoA hydratase/carnithine racemase